MDIVNYVNENKKAEKTDIKGKGGIRKKTNLHKIAQKKGNNVLLFGKKCYII